MYGSKEIMRSNFKSEMIAKEAKVIPIAKEPELPTKILPRKFIAPSKSHTIKGAMSKLAFEIDITIRPIKTMAGQIVSSPFNPPS